MSEYDPFATEGGNFGDIDATLVDAIFKMDDKFPDDDGNAQCQLIQTWEADDREIGENGRFTRFLSVGKGWETEDGTRAFRADDPDEPHSPNPKSKYGRFITQMGTCKNVKALRPVLIERYDDGKGLTSQDAGWLIGCKFHLVTQSEPYKLADGSKGMSDILAPSEFLGVEETGKKAPAKKKAAAKKTAKKAEAERDENGLTAAQMDKAREIYNEVPDDETASTEFIARALDELAEIDSIDDAAAFIAAEDDGLFDLLNG